MGSGFSDEEENKHHPHSNASVPANTGQSPNAVLIQGSPWLVSYSPVYPPLLQPPISLLFTSLPTSPAASANLIFTSLPASPWAHGYSHIYQFTRLSRSPQLVLYSPVYPPLPQPLAVADPEYARGGGVSHILSEKRGVSFTLLKKCMKIQYFHQ